MLVPVLCLLLLQLGNGEGACQPYQSSCTFLTAEMCCGFPLTTLCLPDSRGGFSCLSPFDIPNLSTAFTSLNPLAPALGQAETSIRQALNPATDPLANPLLDPLANPILDPLANPMIDPLANPMFNPLLSQPPASS